MKGFNRIVTVGFLTTFLWGCESPQSAEPSQEIEVSTEHYESEIQSQVLEETVNLKPSKSEFIEKYPNGKLKTEGHFDENGERQGTWYSYYESGIKWSQSEYKAGLKEGATAVYYPNGNIRYKGQYKNDQKIGHWEFFDENGQPTQSQDF